MCGSAIKALDVKCQICVCAVTLSQSPMSKGKHTEECCSNNRTSGGGVKAILYCLKELLSTLYQWDSVKKFPSVNICVSVHSHLAKPDPKAVEQHVCPPAWAQSFCVVWCRPPPRTVYQTLLVCVFVCVHAGEGAFRSLREGLSSSAALSVTSSIVHMSPCELSSVCVWYCRRPYRQSDSLVIV